MKQWFNLLAMPELFRNLRNSSSGYKKSADKVVNEKRLRRKWQMTRIYSASVGPVLSFSHIGYFSAVYIVNLTIFLNLITIVTILK